MKHYLHHSLRALFLFLAMFLSLPMLAVEVEIDGILYDLLAKTKQATVIAKKSGKYSGDIVIPESVEYRGTTCRVTSIGDKAFYDCHGLISATIGNSVTSIGHQAFNNCWALTSVTIGNSVTSIGDKAFFDCYGLTSITIPNSVTSIGEDAFCGCSGLTSVTIPNSVTNIGDCAFYWCSGLTSVTIGNSVTSIGDKAFFGCYGLTSVTIGNSVTSIGDYAFFDCYGLTSITIPNSVTSIGGHAFSDCSGLTSVTIPNSVKSIGEQTFAYCSGLASVTIGNSLTIIGSFAFYGCSGLTSVTIGYGVKNIGEFAFAGCEELLDVYCYAEEVPATSGDAFNGSYIEYANLHVPDASIESYKTKVPWKGFGNIIGLSDIPKLEKCATPFVTYTEGKLSLSCQTEGAEFVTKIASEDINTFNSAEIELSATYNIEVYATKANYENSDTVNVALVWVENGKVGEESGVISVEAAPVLIQANGGNLTINGVAKGCEIVVYTLNGTEVTRATATEGSTTINTGLQSGTVAIVKLGNKSVKIKI